MIVCYAYTSSDPCLLMAWHFICLATGILFPLRTPVRMDADDRCIEAVGKPPFKLIAPLQNRAPRPYLSALS